MCRVSACERQLHRHHDHRPAHHHRVLQPVARSWYSQREYPRLAILLCTSWKESGGKHGIRKPNQRPGAVHDSFRPQILCNKTHCNQNFAPGAEKQNLRRAKTRRVSIFIECACRYTREQYPWRKNPSGIFFVKSSKLYRFTHKPRGFRKYRNFFTTRFSYLRKFAAELLWYNCIFCSLI